MEKFNTSTENKSWKLEGSQLTSEKKEIFEKTSKELSDLKKAILAEPKSKIWSSEVTTRAPERPTQAQEASTRAPEIPITAPEMTEPSPKTVPGERDVAPQVTQEIPTPAAPEASTRAPEMPTPAQEASTRAPEMPTPAPETTEPRPETVPGERDVAPQVTEEIPTPAPEASTRAPERPEPTI